MTTLALTLRSEVGCTPHTYESVFWLHILISQAFFIQGADMEFNMWVENWVLFNAMNSGGRGVVKNENSDKRGESLCLRMGTVFVTISGVCFFLAIYFGILSQSLVMDELLRVQLTALATSFFVGGAVVAILFALTKIIAMRMR
jgi:hypothetical protein